MNFPGQRLVIKRKRQHPTVLQAGGCDACLLLKLSVCCLCYGLARLHFAPKAVVVAGSKPCFLQPQQQPAVSFHNGELSYTCACGILRAVSRRLPADSISDEQATFTDIIFVFSAGED
eukprot:GHRQ01017262.1.p1 GENE.GHRQ01017262.1~~GHRQ01017262.1.p1  ORF type:complete len:118 (-),score=12.60 GHRQ01017262.1:180-533(-)